MTSNSFQKKQSNGFKMVKLSRVFDSFVSSYESQSSKTDVEGLHRGQLHESTVRWKEVRHASMEEN